MLKATVTGHTSSWMLPAVSPATADALVAELVCAKLPGDSHALAANRREAAIRELFGTLAPPESLALQLRLELAMPDDELALAFLRLVPERRARLLAHLAELRRRRM